RGTGPDATVPCRHPGMLGRFPSGSRPRRRLPRHPLTWIAMTMTDIRDLPPPDALIFDLDGTLVDSVETRIRAWLQTFDEIGIPTSRDELVPLIGLDGKRL